MIRPSSLPLFAKCPSSQLATDWPVDEPNEAGDIGIRGHGDIADHLTTGAPWPEWLDKEMPLARGMVEGAVSGNDRLFAEIEVPMESRYTRGTADLAIHWDSGAIVYDWKTTREIHQDHAEQMIAYAHLAMETFKVDVVTVRLVYFRLGVVTEQEFNRSDVDVWIEWLRIKQDDIGKAYAPGPHCNFCKRKNECGARTNSQLSAVTALTEAHSQKVVTRQDVAEMYWKSELARAALDHYDDLVKEMIQETPLDLPDGRVIKLQSYETTEINARKAWPIAKKFAGDGGLEAAASLSWPTLRKHVAKDLAEEFERQLLNNGALTKIRRTKKHVSKEK
jgi:hypothetical protein